VSPAHRPVRAPGKRPLREGESGRSALWRIASGEAAVTFLAGDPAAHAPDCPFLTRRWLRP